MSCYYDVSLRHCLLAEDFLVEKNTFQFLLFYCSGWNHILKRSASLFTSNYNSELARIENCHNEIQDELLNDELFNEIQWVVSTISVYDLLFSQIIIILFKKSWSLNVRNSLQVFNFFNFISFFFKISRNVELFNCE